MSDFPLLHLTVTDFRRIEGARQFPLDAPVVLIHGPNGTGKTSLLSALELALTGAIRSMERQSEQYMDHLPFFGQPFATVQALVTDSLMSGSRNAKIKVGGSHSEGRPALQDDAASFYAERCYLDQASLSRLLDLYQDREGSGQSALEKFVNELLGLEKLDALRAGLSDANDFRRLKRLALGVDEAVRQVKATDEEYADEVSLRTDARIAITAARMAVLEAMDSLGLKVDSDTTNRNLIRQVRAALRNGVSSEELATATTVHQELVALGGRISALVERPTPPRVDKTRTALATAKSASEKWNLEDGERVRAWEAVARAEAEAAGVVVQSEVRLSIENALLVLTQKKESDSAVRKQLESLTTDLAAERLNLESLQNQLADAHEHSSALVEILSAARLAVEDTGDTCPVCERDFRETGRGALPSFIDSKLEELTTHGEHLVRLRGDRDRRSSQVVQMEAELAQLQARSLPADQLSIISERIQLLSNLATQTDEIEQVKARGADLARTVNDLQKALDDVEAQTAEEVFLAGEIVKYASRLKVEATPTTSSFKSVWNQLLVQAQENLSHLSETAERHRDAKAELGQLEEQIEHEAAIAKRLAEIADRKKLWSGRLREAKRRQGIAREVHEAATRARTNIVQRVFTQSLNDVWKSVFTRLAPNENFVPGFGIPSANKKAFDIKLKTTHKLGQTSGPPQMMLSAGNLNTAALSLFLALHLAVEPVVPCLVFDDPVQAMDEVHVAQFAALVRLLAKRNARQVIIAVHERELFEYLSLELSPAFEGDELITIELGGRAEDEDGGVTRHVWRPDVAVQS
ncbi:AAA family ATPase [Microcella sp.]|uniref:AAA family ATPase n=1 Tax=Microcella sp. TaxID=1913979 RepID=UPI00255F6397|nr:AAA family ATPase [Microcella sp.]MBX9470373.1 AAA family ATPase [Microcella sp.]